MDERVVEAENMVFIFGVTLIVQLGGTVNAELL